MANNNQNINITVSGNTSGLQNALDQGQRSLATFGSNSEGLVSDFANRFSGGIGQTSLAMSGLAGSVAVAGALIGITLSKVAEQSEKAFETFQAATLSQMSLPQIQQMANLYAQVGLNLDQIANQQKDIKDRIGDSITNLAGSMYTDVIQPLHLNVLELQKMADSGQDVYAKIYFAAKAQGLSTSQMVNMFETMGNDATKRLTVLQQYNNAQEYQNALANQTVQLTAEQSGQFEEYRKSTQALSLAWDKWENDTLAPVAGRLSDILNLMTKILNSKPVAAAAAATGEQGINQVKGYQQNFQQDLLKNSSIYGTQLVEQNSKDTAALNTHLEFITNLANANVKDLKTTIDEINKGTTKGTLDSGMKVFQTSKAAAQQKIDQLDEAYKNQKDMIQKSLLSAYKGDFAAQKKAISDLNSSYKEKRDELVKQRDAGSASDASKAKSAADKELAAKQKHLNELTSAQAVWDKVQADMLSKSGTNRLAELERQHKGEVLAIQKAGATLGKTKSDIDGAITESNMSYGIQRKEMVQQDVGITNPITAIQNQNQNIANNMGSLSQDDKYRLSAQQGQAINGDTDSTYLDQRLKDLEAERDAQIEQAELLLGSTEDFEKRKADIKAKYAAESIQLQASESQQTLSMYQASAEGISNTMTDSFGKNSSAARASFAISKGLAIAQSILAIKTGLAEAMSKPFPESLANYAQVAAAGMQIIGDIKGVSGQFHGGIDSLPSDLDNKSFVLKQGERVIQPEANKDLTKFLSNQKQSTTGGNEYTINAPLIVQGSVDDDSKFQKMLKKHSQSVNQAVREAQSRNT
ncbi:TPA: hypothetical protein QCK11_004728 [Enterobacter asburiae]|nr:hypothetical protein [Enterobacter asburiae]